LEFDPDRWAEGWLTSEKEFHGIERSDAEVPRLTLRIGNEEKSYAGDATVFAWHTGAAAVPHTLEGALMALEYWLYTEAEKGTLKPETIAKLFDGSLCVANY
jgi:hypothetical protein